MTRGAMAQDFSMSLPLIGRSNGNSAPWTAIVLAAMALYGIALDKVASFIDQRLDKETVNFNRQLRWKRTREPTVCLHVFQTCVNARRIRPLVWDETFRRTIWAK